MAENTSGGIKFESALAEVQKIATDFQQAAEVHMYDGPAEEFSYNDVNPDDYQI